ncbi:MAG TPA: 30S ribosomal protein S15 [Candidatus Saccharimonadales bacterium]|nr:30S ribosomal protein S15 [Candidatus Saccharimonadales bacterium]
MITSEKKQSIIAELTKDKKNTGSPEAQVGILTARIAELTEHLKVNKKDFAARRGLLQMVGKRKKLLKYLADNEPKKYLALIKKLNIRK